MTTNLKLKHTVTNAPPPPPPPNNNLYIAHNIKTDRHLLRTLLTSNTTNREPLKGSRNWSSTIDHDSGLYTIRAPIQMQRALINKQLCLLT